MAVSSTLGDYLRARRELIHPDEVGLPAGERRRVPGLRREEVALLAGISVEYYLRLEQGRDQHPSAQVLDGIANALRLDPDAAAYLHGLARPLPVKRRRSPRPERVRTGVRDLIANWTTTPAYVQGRTLWARHDVRYKTSGLTPMLHPQVGPLDLRYEKFALPQASQMLITYHAEPGSESEQRLHLLATLAT